VEFEPYYDQLMESRNDQGRNSSIGQKIQERAERFDLREAHGERVKENAALFEKLKWEQEWDAASWFEEGGGGAGADDAAPGPAGGVDPDDL
jgi:hypothetical protein